MLGGPGHNGPTPRQPARGAEEREVDSFGARGGERNLGAVGAQRLRRQVTSGVERGACGAPFGVRTRWIAVGEVAKSFADFGEQRRRTGVVEGDAASRGFGPAAGSAPGNVPETPSHKTEGPDSHPPRS